MIASSNLGRKLKLVLGAHSANEKFQWQETRGALKHKSTKIEKFSTKYVILSEYFMWTMLPTIVIYHLNVRIKWETPYTIHILLDTT